MLIRVWQKAERKVYLLNKVWVKTLLLPGLPLYPFSRLCFLKSRE